MIINTKSNTLAATDYCVEKIKYGKKGKNIELTTLRYNAKITLISMSLVAYEYMVNDALEFIISAPVREYRLLIRKGEVSMPHIKRADLGNKT